MGIRSRISRSTPADANERWDWRIYASKAAVKLHALLDLRGNIPAFIHISDGKLHTAGGFFVTRDKSNLKAQRHYSHPVDRSTGLILPALTITELYRCCWQVELFCKWIKQHLRIKQFYGTTENAVKTQIWTAVATYVLVAIVKKRLKIQASLCEMLQILSLTMFEQTPLNTLLSQTRTAQNDADPGNQLNLFR